MKKYLNKAMFFCIYGLACGVYFREFTKFNKFTNRTMLGMAHPHVLMLGLGVYLLVAIFVKLLDINENRKLNIADLIYTIGVIVASVMMLVRGTMEVALMPMSASVSAMISGIAGLGHIAVAVGLVMFINTFRKAA